ncbi:hypothetical protein B1810_08135 [Panacagrimonas perspica]|nr:hypothetical protein B1810_08135 [Panacagrimonas perspica]
MRALLARYTLEHVPPQDLKHSPRALRRHPPKQLRAIKKSLVKYRHMRPILVDRDGVIVDGDALGTVACQMKLSHVPVIRIDHLSKEELRQLTIALNRTQELGSWDFAVLSEDFAEFLKIDDTFDFDGLGFEPAEVDRIMLTDHDRDSAPDPGDEILDPGPAVTRVGDLWMIGKHRVLCGNSLDTSTLDRLTDKKPASAVFTDPPYNVPIDKNVGGNGSIRHREFAMASGEMTKDQFTAFLAVIFSLLAKHSKPGSIHYICIDWRHLAEVLAASRDAYTELKNICVWAKDTAGMGSFYRSQHELVFVFKSGVGSHRNNIQLGKHGRNRSNVWKYPNVGVFGRKTEEGSLLAMHPTVKPVAMVADALLDSTDRGNIVLDPFLGSGTTLIAADRTGRVCYGIELDPAYVDIAIRRLQKLTGQKAVHAESGRSFDNIQSESRSHG